MSRQIILDTETTGLSVELGHRVIEIGCVELKNRRPTGNNFHRYIHPEDKQIDAGAEQVHGITMKFLADKPRFGELAQELWNYLEGAELVIHNAPFDMGFLEMEFGRLNFPRKLAEVCTVTDTVSMARRLHPGQKANLDALCRRYGVDNSNRDLHGALLDARLLADVYLAMTGGQSKLTLDADAGAGRGGTQRASRLAELLPPKVAPVVVMPSEAESHSHQARLAAIQKKTGGKLVWDADLPS